MSAESAPSQENMEWGRINLLKGLNEIMHNCLGAAAIYITDQHEAVTVLAGTVEPLDQGTQTAYQNMTAYLIARTTFDGQRRYALTFGANMFQPPLYRYDPISDPAMLTTLTPENTAADRQHLHRLERAHFDATLAENMVDILFNDDRPVLTPWHTTLGIRLPDRRKELEQ